MRVLWIFDSDKSDCHKPIFHCFRSELVPFTTHPTDSKDLPPHSLPKSVCLLLFFCNAFEGAVWWAIVVVFLLVNVFSLDWISLDQTESGFLDVFEGKWVSWVRL